MALKFEWNKSEGKDNYERHGVSFELAKEVFKDPFVVEFLDDRRDYGEERFVIIGIVTAHVLYVAYTERQDLIRIISARRAAKHE
ncbi:MAG TPA: BrnT family toxin [Candidatus Acidoferrum sp.]|nr:BrnT family toxin [Candidatus Acidoferrum sp.]